MQGFWVFVMISIRYKLANSPATKTMHGNSLKISAYFNLLFYCQWRQWCRWKNNSRSTQIFHPIPQHCFKTEKLLLVGLQVAQQLLLTAAHINTTQEHEDNREAGATQLQSTITFTGSREKPQTSPEQTEHRQQQCTYIHVSTVVWASGFIIWQ